MKILTTILFLVTVLTISGFCTTTSDSANTETVVTVDGSSIQNISFTVVCIDEADINSEAFVTLMKAFHLKKGTAAQIDGGMYSINLVATTKMDSPVELGKKLSLANDNILLVKVNNINNNTEA